MVIITKQKALHTCNMDINAYLGSTPLKQVSCIDYLGIKLDQHLLWNEQVDNLCKIMVFIISRFRRLKNVLNPRMMIDVYNSIIQPKFDYALTVWGNTSNQNIRKTQLLPNRTARIIKGNYDYINIRGID